MKFLIKILLFVLVALVSNVYATSTTITFTNIQVKAISFLFNNETPKTISGVIENENGLAAYCQNDKNFLDYRNWGTGNEANAAKGVNSSAHLATEGANLSKHLGQLEKYGQAGFKELQNGRFRYYGNVTPASTPGEMIGRRVVREWNPANGGTRTWMETLDGAGRIRIVRPETGGTKVHFMFDKSGNFIKKW